MRNFFLSSKTPHRISLFGGGTDFPYFFRKHSSNIVSFAINKYSYVSVKSLDQKFFSEKYRLNYSSSERVNDLKKIKNKIIRRSIQKFKIKDPLYISTISDIPTGTGLGSSGAFSVGLCKILSKLNKLELSNLELAKIAIEVENEKLENAGYQDQFASAYGGVNYFKFSKNTIQTKSLIKYKKIFDYLCEKSLLVWTGLSRNSNKILDNQRKNLNINENNLIKLNELTLTFLDNLNNFSYTKFAKLLNSSNHLKSSFSKLIFSDQINSEIRQIKSNKNILAHKLLGAGGGGFIICFFKDNKSKLNFMKKRKNILEFKISSDGSKVKEFS